MSVIRFPGDSAPRNSRDGAKLLKPRQGFESLRQDGWELYTLARRLGGRDSGTYNPAATLPGGGKSDHAYKPARAFDISLTDTFTRARARWYYRHCKTRAEVEYVIFERLIWSRTNGERPYTAGGHDTHVHVSLRHPAL